MLARPAGVYPARRCGSGSRFAKMNLSNLQKILRDEPPYRLKQAYQAVFKNCVRSWDEATIFPKDLRENLKKECPIEINARLNESADGKTAKAALIFDDGVTVEAVLMRQADGRNTLCLSSQAGCPLGCGFCITGKKGFRRNLNTDEIITQALFFARYLHQKNERISNAVFMGMGEPFLNYDAVLTAIRILNDKDFFNIGARKISISTCGIVEGIKKLANEPLQINLAISLHAPNDKMRAGLMPIDKKYPIKKVLEATAGYIKKTGRRVMIEYLMLKNINDGPEHARELSNLLKKELRRLFFVNIIPHNPTGFFDPAEGPRIKRFKDMLERTGITVTQRFRFGRDIKGACGQLAGENEN